MLLEDFEGTVVFATNLMENYDSAFNSRILRHIQFELPNKELRRAMILKMIPQRTPQKEGDFDDAAIDQLVELSEGFSGREIKNAILNGIIASVRTKDYFAFEDAKQSFTQAKATAAGASKSQNDSLKADIEKKLRRIFKKTSSKRRPGAHRPQRAQEKHVQPKLYKEVHVL